MGGSAVVANVWRKRTHIESTTDPHSPPQPFFNLNKKNQENTELITDVHMNEQQDQTSSSIKEILNACRLALEPGTNLEGLLVACTI